MLLKKLLLREYFLFHHYFPLIPRSNHDMMMDLIAHVVESKLPKIRAKIELTETISAKEETSMMRTLMMVLDDFLPLDYDFSWINVHFHSNCICRIKRRGLMIKREFGKREKERKKRTNWLLMKNIMIEWMNDQIIH